MWSTKGRSGYGDSTIGGDYDSWDGISPNGRQYKNEATMETRDLSGADYWNLRKQNRPTEEIPAHLHMLKNGKANIDAYADKEAVKKVSKIPLKNKVIPQLTRYNNLTEQMREIVAQYHAKEIDIKEYTLLMDITVAKRERAKILLDKAMSLKPVRSEEIDTKTYNNFSSRATDSYEQNVANDVENMHRKASFVSKIAGHSAVKDLGWFLGWSSVLLVAFKVFF